MLEPLRKKGNIRLTSFQREQERVLTDRAKHSSEFTQAEMGQLQRLKQKDLEHRIQNLQKALRENRISPRNEERVKILIQLLEHRLGVYKNLDVTKPQRNRAVRLLSQEHEAIEQLKAYAKINVLRPKVEELKRELEKRTSINKLPNDTFKKSIEAVGFTAKTGISNLDLEQGQIGRNRELRQSNLDELGIRWGYSYNALGTLYEWAKENISYDPKHAMFCLRELHDALLNNPLFASNKKFQRQWLKKVIELSEQIPEEAEY